MSKTDQAILLVGASSPPNRALYFGFKPASFRKWYSLNQLTFSANKWSPMSSMASNFRSTDEQGWRNGQTTSGSLLHSCPLQQNWIQIFSCKSQGKILFIFILVLPEHSHIWLGTFHRIISPYQLLLILALDRRWHWPALRCCSFTLISCRSTRCLLLSRGKKSSTTTTTDNYQANSNH